MPTDYIYLEAEVELIKIVAERKAIFAYETALMRKNKDNPLRICYEKETKMTLKKQQRL